MRSTKENPRGLTLAEAAEEFGYTIRTLERAKELPRINPRHLPVDQTSRPYRVTRNAMRTWILKNTR